MPRGGKKREQGKVRGKEQEKNEEQCVSGMLINMTVVDKPIIL